MFSIAENDLQDDLAVVRSSIEQAVHCMSAVGAEPRFDIWASVEDVLKLGRLERGEVAEARLAAKLMEMGITVGKPISKGAKWDLLAEAGS